MASSSTTASSTSLNRSTPVILTITGAAAVYGCYLYYTNYAFFNTPPIRRRGAVHRHRNRPLHANHTSPADNTNPVNHTESAETLDWGGIAEYGYTSLTVNDAAIRWHLQLGQLPTVRYVAQRYDIDPPEAANLRRDIQIAYVRSWLQQNAPFDNTWGTEEAGGPFTPGDVSQRLQVLGLEPAAVDIAIDEYLESQNTDTTQNTYTTQDNQPEDLQEDPNDDTWTIAETQALPDGSHTGLPTAFSQLTSPRDGQGLKEMLYHIAEQQSRDDNYIHRGITCNSCDTRPIRGIRWHCANCADYDLCSDCESHGIHDKTHIFFKIKIPAPYIYSPRSVLAVTYPGKPTGMNRSLGVGLRKRLSESTAFEMQELDALYEQFSCLAGTSWKEDPDGIGMAIDWAAYSKALMPQSVLNVFLPNLIYSRVFAFYDSDNNGLIGFSEFIKGCAILHKKERGPSSRLRKVFDGYDLSNKGYICREDFLTMFRANYVLQREFVLDLVAVEGSVREGLQSGTEEIVRSAQPLSAAFPEHIEGDSRRRVVEVKSGDLYGERRVEGPVGEDGRDEGTEGEVAAEALDVDDSMPRRDHAVSLAGAVDGSRTESADSPLERSEIEIQQATTQTDLQVEGSNEASAAQGDTHTRHLLYLASLQAINALLNPLFAHREQLASQVLATAPERHRRRSSIARWTAAREAEAKRLQEVADDPLVATARAQPVQIVVESSAEAGGQTEGQTGGQNAAETNRPRSNDADDGIDRVVLDVEQRVNDSSLEDLLRDLGAAPMGLVLAGVGADGEEELEGEVDGDPTDNEDSRCSPDQDPSPESAGQLDGTRSDPTLPQNRPSSPLRSQPSEPSNSPQALLDAIFSPASPHSQASKSAENNLTNKNSSSSSSDSDPQKDSHDIKTPAHYAHLITLNAIEAEALERGGPARISFEEFAAAMEMTRGLGFVESWLELANF